MGFLATLPSLDAGGRGCTRKKLVAPRRRCEDVYNRAAATSVTFCERGGAALYRLLRRDISLGLEPLQTRAFWGDIGKDLEREMAPSPCL